MLFAYNPTSISTSVRSSYRRVRGTSYLRPLLLQTCTRYVIPPSAPPTDVYEVRHTSVRSSSISSTYEFTLLSLPRHVDPNLQYKVQYIQLHAGLTWVGPS
jgi:hypothetical protein